LLLIALTLSGCARKKDDVAAPNPAPPVGGQTVPPATGNPHIDFRPSGGSNTVLGKARDRALDARLMNELRQVKTGLDADGGNVPANKAAWIAFLRDYPTLRSMVDRGELIAFSQVRLGDSNTVLMYEPRIVQHNDGFVLMADGMPYRIDKAKFETLTKPTN
jgi:hypothetical protein